jgi:probable rRNA maturation factor
MMGQYRVDMEINVLIDDDLDGHPEVSWLQGVAERVLTVQGTGSGVELGLVITGQERVRQLNRSYRGRDELTDVLAFSTAEETGTDFPPFVTPPDGVLHLGEVIIACPQAVAQAEEHGHSIKKEMAILIIHGVLHILGYDHEKPEMAREMRAKEMEILNGIEGELK